MRLKVLMLQTITTTCVTLMILGLAGPASALERKSLHLRGRTKTILLVAALHASVIVDAWSTNRVFSNPPNGYMPAEYNLRIPGQGDHDSGVIPIRIPKLI